MNEFKSFETKRLKLKPCSKEDAPFLLELLNTPKWIKYIGDRKVRSIADAEKYIEKKMIPQLKELGFSNYTVIRKSDGKKLGTCGLYDREGFDGIDIGFAFLPQYERNGYAYESAHKMMEVAKKHFKIDHISAITTKENIVSQKLLEKLGLKFKKRIKIPTDDEDLLFYELEM